MAKKKCPEFENHERWLVSFADMLTLLFAVFVTLYALNLSEETPVNNSEAAGSMQESFSTPLEDIPVHRQIGPTEAGFGIFENFMGNQPRPQTTKKFPGIQMQIKVIENEMKKVQQQVEERLYGPEKFSGSKAAGEARIVDIQRTETGFKLQLLARHFYDPGSYRMKKTALDELDKLAKILKELGREITVQGHTDSIPPKGDFTNWEVSALRATHVLRYLIRRHNFPSFKLAAIGYADTKPVAHNGTAEGRAMNRRVELHINYNQEYVSDKQ